MKSIQQQFDQAMAEIDKEIKGVFCDIVMAIYKRILWYSPVPIGSPVGTPSALSTGLFVSNHIVRFDYKGMSIPISRFETKNIDVDLTKSKLTVENAVSYDEYVLDIGWDNTFGTDPEIWPGASAPPYKTYDYAVEETERLDLPIITSNFNMKTKGK